MRIALVLATVLAACAHGNSASAPDAKGSGGNDAPSGPMDSGCGDLPCPDAAIYVAPTGDDQAAGTRDAPLKTIGAGITKAALASPPLAVFVQVGSYAETVAMQDGVSVYGGFDTGWNRVMTMTTEIDGGSPAVTFDRIQSPTTLDEVTVKSADATAPGASSVAVVVTSSSNVTLHGVTVVPGIGAPGLDGSDGVGGASGWAGGSGGAGVEHSGSIFCDDHTLPVGGGGGFSQCSRYGGSGGNPGVGSGNGLPGAGGVTSAGGAGGAGGGHSPACGGAGDGAPGSNGAAGASGGNGAGGAMVGTFMAAAYVPADGQSGGDGADGNGGGGGGGGGGGTSNCDSSGSSGGGGGGGGCHGTAGTAGGGGGGSFGVLAVDSTVVIRASTVMGNQGGNGGRGGNGGAGGAGGNGGAGGPYGGSSEQDDGGCGAPGGTGGAGGSGGAGGGGGGGPSAAVVCVGMASVTIPSSTLTGGIAGSGGASAGNPGATGVSTRAIGCSLF